MPLRQCPTIKTGASTIASRIFLPRVKFCQPAKSELVTANPEITQNIGKRVGATRQRPAFKIFSQAETVTPSHIRGFQKRSALPPVDILTMDDVFLLFLSFFIATVSYSAELPGICGASVDDLKAGVVDFVK